VAPLVPDKKARALITLIVFLPKKQNSAAFYSGPVAPPRTNETPFQLFFEPLLCLSWLRGLVKCSLSFKNTGFKLKDQIHKLKISKSVKFDV
jgi:hypothetical protein